MDGTLWTQEMDVFGGVALWRPIAWSSTCERAGVDRIMKPSGALHPSSSTVRLTRRTWVV